MTDLVRFVVWMAALMFILVGHSTWSLSRWLCAVLLWVNAVAALVDFMAKEL